MNLQITTRMLYLCEDALSKKFKKISVYHLVPGTISEIIVQKNETKSRQIEFSTRYRIHKSP